MTTQEKSAPAKKTKTKKKEPKERIYDLSNSHDLVDIFREGIENEEKIKLEFANHLKKLAKKRLFDVSSGFQNILYRRCQEVNHANECFVLSESSGSCFRRLKNTVESLNTSVAVA